MTIAADSLQKVRDIGVQPSSPRPTTIAILSFANAVHTVRWANALHNRGFDCHVISQHDPSPELLPGVQFHRLRFSGHWGYFSNVFQLRSILKRLKPSLLHVHYAAGYGVLGWLSWFHPRIVSVWGADVYVTPYESRVNRWLITKSIISADHICSTSEVMATQTRRLLSAQREISVTPFGVDMRRFAPAAPRVDADTIYIGTVKSMDTKYGIDTLLKGFALVRQQLQGPESKIGERLRLRIYGGGPKLEEYRSLADTLGIGGMTEFSGQIPHDDVPNALRSLDVYVAVSRCHSESFGVAIIEASACGLPVVVSDVGGLPEVVHHNSTGIIIPPEDPAALAGALTQLVLDADLRGRLGEAGRAWVLQEYEWNDNVDRMLKVYSHVLGLQLSTCTSSQP